MPPAVPPRGVRFLKRLPAACMAWFKLHTPHKPAGFLTASDAETCRARFRVVTSIKKVGRCYRASDTVEPLRLLVDYGWFRSYIIKRDDGGRPTTTYEAHPQLVTEAEPETKRKEQTA